ncbi:MAG: hypothetical protein Q9222_004415 [Ikaeria aurantiellina]
MGSMSAFSSKIFKVFVGPSADLFYVHADVLARSRVLKKEVEGSWKEKSERKITWASWKPDVADKFFEWLYTGDYHCPYPSAICDLGESSHNDNDEVDEIRSRDRSIAVERPDDPIVVPTVERAVIDSSRVTDDESSNNVSEMPRAKTMRNLPAQPLNRLQELQWEGCRSLEKLTQAEEFDRWTGHQLWSPDQLDYEVTLLLHAELYVMACHYMLDGLKNMAWQRLRSVLITVGVPQVGSPVISNVVSLIHYVYEETGETTDGAEPLRELLVTFAALHFTSFRGIEVDELMMSTQESDREFVVDLMVKVMQQTMHLEAKGQPAAADEPELIFEECYASGYDRKSKKKKGRLGYT